MKKIKFLFQRIINMEYDKFFEAINIVHERTGKNRVIIFLDMVYCGFKYHGGYIDYLDFEFYDLNREQRASYVTRGDSLHYVQTLNDYESRKLVDDKAKFLEMFDKEAGRHWINVEKCSYEEFEIFFKENPKIIAKEKSNVGGQGIDFYEYDGSNIKEVYDRLNERKQFVVEEIIKQHSELSRLHPTSVNTLRFMTFQINGQVEIAFVGLRTGNGGRVDNLSDGGFSARVDIDTGIISSNGTAKYGHVVEAHPMTGVKFKGFQIPEFDKAKAFVVELAKTLPKLGFIAWDISILDNNEVIVIEANDFPGHHIYQLPETLDASRLGMKPVFDEIIERLSKGA